MTGSLLARTFPRLSLRNFAFFAPLRWMFDVRWCSLIAGVQRGSPADAGGVKPGDILLAVNGKNVKDPQGMLDLIADLKPGDTIPFKLRRQNTAVDAAIRIGKRPPQRREQE